MASFGLTELRALQESYRAFLRGDALTAESLEPLGRLAGLWIHDAHWRPEGPARVRRFLAAGLTAFGDAEHAFERAERTIAAGRRAAGATAGAEPEPTSAVIGWRDMVFVLRRVIGLDAFPVSSAEAVRALRSTRRELPDGIPGESVAGTWAAQVFSDERVLDHLGSFESLPRRVDPPPGARPPWTDYDHQSWPFGARREADRRDLVIAAQQSLRAMSPTLDLIEGPVMIELLRAAVAGRLRVFFASAAQLDALLHVEHAADGWRRAARGTVSAGPLGPTARLSGGGSRYRQKAAAAAELYFWSVAHGWEGRALLEVAKHHLYEIPLLDRMATWQRDDPLDDQAALARRLGALATETPLARVHHEAGRHLALRPAGLAFSPREAMERADAIRRESGDARLLLGREYVRLRIAYEESSPPPSLELFLADVSVELDLTHVKAESLIADLRGVKRQVQEGNRGLGYLLFADRNDALLDMNVREQYDVALSKFVEGLQRLRLQRGAVSGKEYLETCQQFWLALAGLCTKLIESHLRHRRVGYRPPGTARYLALALRAADEVEHNLDQLDQHLRTRRHDDGHISSESWRVMTRLVRVRALLAVHTLVEAGLAEPPAGLLQPLPGLPVIRSAYERLIQTAELGPGNRPYVLQLALWLAFVDGGVVPVSATTSAALGLASGPDDEYPVLLTVDPARIDEEGVTTKALDVDRAAAWLTARDHPAGTLATVPVRGPVARLVRDRSGDGFTDWLGRYGASPFGARERPPAGGAPAPRRT